jgi:hypothetical protein
MIPAKVPSYRFTTLGNTVFQGTLASIATTRTVAILELRYQDKVMPVLTDLTMPNIIPINSPAYFKSGDRNSTQPSNKANIVMIHLREVGKWNFNLLDLKKLSIAMIMPCQRPHRI